MKVLILGDHIYDHYKFCRATRLCPEAPAPVLICEKKNTCEGGAGLVASQMFFLLPKEDVRYIHGSVSEKERIFADRTLVCRLDKDSVSVVDAKEYSQNIRTHLPESDAVVVGDYGKGAIPPTLARRLVNLCRERNIPLFVDAKSNPEPYKNCFAIFPNEYEHNGIKAEDYSHVIRKLGPKGCSVDGVEIKTEEQQVYDVTGAGDIFIAAFVSKWLKLGLKVGFENRNGMIACAQFANKAAGISVRHLGTYIVKPEELSGNSSKYGRKNARH